MLKYGRMFIGENIFRTPYTYSFPMKLGDGIQMIIGCNFIRAMHGGVRIEGNVGTFYKNLTTINTLPSVTAATAIEEMDLEEEEYIQIQEIVSYNTGPSQPKFLKQFSPLLKELKEQGYIGENLLQHWAKNKVICHLYIKNPDFTIEDKPLKHLTPQMKDSFSKHIEALLKINVIRLSKSRHCTTAIIVQLRTLIDPITQKEVKGKERMVFNSE